MDATNIALTIIVFGLIVGMALYAWTRELLPSLYAILLCGVVGITLVVFNYVETDNPQRYISANEKRAATMFKQNCKQVGFVQANNSTDLGVGVSSNGNPVVGTIFSSNEDSYVYHCDEGIQYTLTYDIEKYRKYYQ